MEATALAEGSDAEVVAEVVRGVRASFEILVRRHNQRLYRAARAITRTDADAEDVLQQTWLAEEAVRVRLHRGRAAVAAALDHEMADVYSFDGARCDRITEHVMRNVMALP